MKRILSSFLVFVMAFAVAVPMYASASDYPQTYDVEFVVGDTVIQENTSVPYIESIQAPAGYKDVTTWYCSALDMEVENGETIWADDFGMDQTVVFEADSVLPDSFTLNFRLPNGVPVAETVLDPVDFYTFFTVPTVDGANVTWTADQVTLTGGTRITGQDMDLDYVWYEKNPVLNFELTSEAVYPDAFTVKFIDDNDQVVSEQTVSAWDFYTGIQIPEGNWMCYRLRLLASEGDYISGQTLDLDFSWYGSHPVVEFYAN